MSFFNKLHIKTFQYLLVIVSFLLIFFANQVHAATYYVSSSDGNDSYSGTSTSTPWKTLTKINSRTFSAGDLILFKSGDVWEGTLSVPSSGTSSSPITYGSYGTGDKPKIYGSTPIIGWTLHSGNIYKATVASNVNQLFLNNTRMKAARFPNSGYATISSVGGTTTFTSNSLNSNINYSGATWIGRVNPYATHTTKVSSSSGNALTIGSIGPSWDSLAVGEGFILVNKLEFLDSAGEWYYDENTDTLYLWTPNGNSPSNYEVRASIYDNGVSVISKNYVTISNLELLHYKNGIYSNSSSNITISNNKVKDSDSKGIYLTNTSSSVVSNNFVDGANHYGVLAYASSCLFSDNQITNTFLFDNLGISGSLEWFSGNGLHIEGTGNQIRYNTITNGGYNGIAAWYNALIEYNYINNVGLTKNDGGGIYTSAAANYPNASNTGMIIRNNIVDGAYGTVSGEPSGHLRAFQGIYLDESSGGITVENNTVTNTTDMGIFAHKGYNHTIRYNTSYRNRRGFGVNIDGRGININNNIVYGFSRDLNNQQVERMLYQDNLSGQPTINNNTYVNHYQSTGLFSTAYSTHKSFTDWKTFSGQDANSTFDSSALPSGYSEQLFYNNTKVAKSFPLTKKYLNLSGSTVSSPLVLQPFTSQILINTNGDLVVSDTTSPTISSFTIPSTSSSLSVPISTFTATDNVGVTGYLIKETSSTPSIGDSGWVSSAPSSYTFTSAGSKTLYAWVKDSAGNVSVSSNDSVVITLSDLTPKYSNYSFDELSGSTVFDSQGLYNGTIMTEINRVSGLSGNGLSFTGTGYVNIPNAYSDIQNKFTLSAWLKPNPSGSYQGVIMHGGPNIDTFALYTKYSTTKAVALKTSGTSYQFFEVSGLDSLWDGSWHHLVATYDGSSSKIYLDGGLVGQVANTGNIDSGVSYNLLIGAGRDTIPPTLNYYGSVDQVRIYNYALTGTQISSLYNLDKSDTTSPTISSFTIPSTSSSLSVPISTFTATDNVGVTGYLIKETSSTPSIGDSGWVSSAPSSYTFTSAGSKTLYAWVKDSAGNVSASLTDSTTITLPVTTYTLTYTALTGGVISGTASQIVNSGGSGTTVTAVPNTGYHFVSWSDGFTSSSRIDTNVTANTSVSATFAINTYTLTINKLGTGGGTVTGGTYNYGTTAQAVATPSTGSTFTGWGGDCNSNGQVVMTSNRTCTATFTLNNYTIVSGAGSGGTISPIGTTSKTYGSSQTYTITPSSGYSISNVLVDGISVGTGSTYNFSNINTNHTISVTFTQNIVSPTISDITAVSSSTSAVTISWKTSDLSTSQIHYGTTTNYDKSLSVNTTLTKSHSVTLTNLKRNTTYHFKIKATDSSSMVSESNDQTMKTLSRFTRTPKVISLTASSGSIILSWKPPLDDDGNTYELYAGSIIMRSTTGFVDSPNPATAVADVKSGISTFKDTNVIDGTKYYYSIFAYDDLGVYSLPENISFIAPVTTKPSSGGGGGGGGGSSSSGANISSTPLNPNVSVNNPVITPTPTYPNTNVITDTNRQLLTQKLTFRSPSNSKSEVILLQTILSQKGYYNSSIDGSFGKGTLSAVISFQKANGLVPDGIVGAKTRELLNNNQTLTNQNVSNNIPVYNTTSTSILTKKLSFRSPLNDSNEVVTLQQILISKGYLTGVPDGKFGPKTLQAVISFQKANGLVPDGVVGAKTRELLNK